MKFNPEIHKRRSIRLKGYDYSQAGLYFITICVKDRECLFGKIETGKMILNDAGEVANQCWVEISKHFPNAILHEHIVMPNHIHGIIELTVDTNVGAGNFLPLHDTALSTAGVENYQSLQNQFQKMIPRSIGSIVKGFKIGVTKWFRNNMPVDFPPHRQIWQRNYYEHIIRNEQAYQNISNYIINNTSKWQEDKFYTL